MCWGVNLALLLIQTSLNENERRGGAGSLVVGESHAAFRVHRAGSVKLKVRVDAQEPLAEIRSSLGESLDFWTSDLLVVLELLANVLAEFHQVLLEIFLAHWNFVQIEANARINDIIDKLTGVIDIGFTTSEFTTATDINRRTRILYKNDKINTHKGQSSDS